MEMIKNFVIALVSTIIFMTAIELIAPDNSMKKYIKFVLGLVLITVILTPIVSLITKGESVITEEILNYEETITAGVTIDENQKSTNDMKEESFKDNFNRNCENLLKEKYKNDNFKCNLDCSIDFNNMTFKVKELRVTLVDKAVKKVEKIEIGKNKEENPIEDSKQKEIKDYLASELEIDRSKIKVEYSN